MNKVLGVAAAALMLAASTQAAVIISPTLNDGGLNAGAAGDNVSSAFWTISARGNFESLNRALGPDGSGPQEGALSFVMNGGGSGVLTSLELDLGGTIQLGDTFDASVWGATKTAGMPLNSSVTLRFDNGSSLLLIDAVAHNTAVWTQASATGVVVDAANVGATKVSFEWVGANPGASATDQYYADNFNLSYTEAVPEPATLGLLGLAFGGLVMLRRRRK